MGVSPKLWISESDATVIVTSGPESRTVSTAAVGVSPKLRAPQPATAVTASSGAEFTNSTATAPAWTELAKPELPGPVTRLWTDLDASVTDAKGAHFSGTNRPAHETTSGSFGEPDC